MTPSTLVYTSTDTLELILEVCSDCGSAFRSTLIMTGLEGTNGHYRKVLASRVLQFLVENSPLVLRAYPTRATAFAAARLLGASLELFNRAELSEYKDAIVAVETVEMECVAPPKS
jgi:hypothetical protein